MSCRRFQYRLRSFLLITALAAAVAGVLGSQINGRIQTEGDPPFVTDFGWTLVSFSTGSSPTLAFVCKSEDDARKLTAQFDKEQFVSQVNAIAHATAPASSHARMNYCVTVGRSDTMFFIKYDFARWGKYRLDARRMAYVFDPNDPAAESRNAAVHHSFQQAGEALAQKNPVIQKWVHSP